MLYYVRFTNRDVCVPIRCVCVKCGMQKLDTMGEDRLSLGSKREDRATCVHRASTVTQSSSYYMSLLSNCWYELKASSTLKRPAIFHSRRNDEPLCWFVNKRGYPAEVGALFTTVSSIRVSRASRVRVHLTVTVRVIRVSVMVSVRDSVK